ncbi:hypothetical protein BBJ28_00018994 [Nothophytophthora sp. Chile5]|nr:hypothetical protein BBJ28_00018994 [Nothophytophthora sp. Chile5]
MESPLSLTQSLRQRIHVESEETTRAREKASECQDETRSLKRRCAKLERKLQEKDTAIQFLQDQQQVRFPLLMHETMRSLRSLEDNQGGSTASSTVRRCEMLLRRFSELAAGAMRSRVDADARIHEYEQQVIDYSAYLTQTAATNAEDRWNVQIAELYEENQQEKLKNEMLNECLRDQKHAKAKLMKACKHAKLELQAVQDSGLGLMLVDIEARCDSLEKEKARLVEELQAERSRVSQPPQRGKQEDEREILTKQLEDLVAESSKWEGNDRSMLWPLLSVFTSQKLTQACVLLCSQIQFIKRRLHALKQLMRAYEETDSVDISLLDETDWDHRDAGSDAAARTCEEYAACLSRDVSEAAQSLAELQQAMEDVCARLMGSSCALQ